MENLSQLSPTCRILCKSLRENASNYEKTIKGHKEYRITQLFLKMNIYLFFFAATFRRRHAPSHQKTTHAGYIVTSSI